MRMDIDSYDLLLDMLEIKEGRKVLEAGFQKDVLNQMYYDHDSINAALLPETFAFITRSEYDTL